MSVAVEYLRAAMAAASEDYERKIIEDAIFAIRTYEEDHGADEAPETQERRG